MRLAPVLIVVAAHAGRGLRAPATIAGVSSCSGSTAWSRSVVDRMIAEGKLPNFAALRDGGASGRLRSSKPLLSPIIWTTIATGKPPDEHGIGHFVATNPQTGKQLPVTSRCAR